VSFSRGLAAATGASLLAVAVWIPFASAMPVLVSVTVRPHCALARSAPDHSVETDTAVLDVKCSAPSESTAAPRFRVGSVSAPGRSSDVDPVRISSLSGNTVDQYHFKVRWDALDGAILEIDL